MLENDLTAYVYEKNMESLDYSQIGPEIREASGIARHSQLYSLPLISLFAAQYRCRRSD